MSKTKQEVTATVDIRGVEADQKTDSLIDIYIAKEKAKGNKMRKGKAVVELAKKGLRLEGIC